MLLIIMEYILVIGGINYIYYYDPTNWDNIKYINYISGSWIYDHTVGLLGGTNPPNAPTSDSSSVTGLLTGEAREDLLNRIKEYRKASPLTSIPEGTH
jgi:hypothetical protein